MVIAALQMLSLDFYGATLDGRSMATGWYCFHAILRNKFIKLPFFPFK